MIKNLFATLLGCFKYLSKVCHDKGSIHTLALSFLVAFWGLTPTAYALPPLPKTEVPDKELYVGILIQDNDSMIPTFFKSIEKYDYNKKKMTIELSSYNTSPKVTALLQDWITENKSHYKQIIDNTSDPADKSNSEQFSSQIKDWYLFQSKLLGCEYCLILTSEVSLRPYAIKYLMQKDKPIISPLLRPIPSAYDYQRNFFADIHPNGNFKDHPDFAYITYRQKLGTFKVPCVNTAYLIQTKYADKLSFSKDLTSWELIAFANNARANNVDQYICNEKEFGEFLHFTQNKSREEIGNFSLISQERTLSLDDLRSIFSPYQNDPTIVDYMSHFNLDEYGLYQAENQDLYLLDDINDPVKSFHLKQNARWGGGIEHLFHKYANPGTIVIDVGGYIGTNAISLSRLVKNHGQVHTFEPDSKLFCEMVINLQLNDRKNCTPYHNALGKMDQMVMVERPKDEFLTWREPEFVPMVNERNRFVKKYVENSSDEIVQMKTLDNFKFNNVSLIHIGLEGSEIGTIQGAKDTIASNMPTLIVKISQDKRTLSKIEMIENFGYFHSPLGNNYYLFIPKPFIK